MAVADMDFAMSLKDTEGWNQTRADWALLLSHNPELCLVAEVNGKAAGTITAINYENKVAWIGMVLVDRNYRGKGISKLLLNALIDKLGTCQSIKLDATPAGKKVYDKLGFAGEYDIVRMTTRKLRSPASVIGAAVELEGLTADKLKGVVAYDEQVFGVNRGKVVHNLAGRHRAKACCFTGAGDVAGYVLSRPGCHYTQVGPLVAATQAHARALLAHVLHTMEGQPVVVDVLAGHRGLVAWLAGWGFERERSFLRMYLKGNPYAGRPQQHFLIAGPELG